MNCQVGNCFILKYCKVFHFNRDYGCPEPGLEDDVFVPWKAGMHDLIRFANVNNPRVGWFAPSCEVCTVLSKQIDSLSIK